MKKTLNIFSNIIIILLAVILIIMIFSKIQGIQYKAVLTASMEPDLPVGSLLIIKPASYNEIEIGDDITYERGNVVVTHRVISKENNMLTTQGTANDIADSPISYENVIGVVKHKIPKIGYLIILKERIFS